MGTEEAIKNIYLLRHGETGFGGRYLGSSDVGIDASGIKQVQKVASALRSTHFDAVLCSPMKRCLESCEILGLSKPAKLEQDLREINFGSWEKKAFSELTNIDLERVSHWVESPETFTFPGGESVVHFHKRVQRVADKIEEMSESNILLIAHGGVIRHLLCNFLRISYQSYLLFDVHPGTYCTVVLYGKSGGVLTGLNHGG